MKVFFVSKKEMKRISAIALLLPLCSCAKLTDFDVEKESKREEALLAESIKQQKEYRTAVQRQRRQQDADKEKGKEKVIYHRNKGTVIADLNHREVIPEYVENFSQSVPKNDFDEVALQMAGKYVPEELKHSRIYYSYLRFLETEWARLKKNSTAHITEWSEQNLAPRAAYEDTVFYPFGGPDIVYALSFFPDASNYILIGLEPIGNFSDIKKNLKDPEIFEKIKKALRTYMRGGYFITSEMVTNLSDHFLRGTLYLILLELSSMGFEINNVENLSLDKNGNETARGKNMADCVKITCTKHGESRSRTVYYIRADLSNSNPCLQNIFNFMKKYTFHTFFKSASYAIWDSTLSKIRKFVLDNSKFILQDDTGIPFHYFDKKWEKYAFGSYTVPTLDLFKGYKQPNMTEFFKNYSLSAIPFKIGYGFYKARPNLLLAVPRKNGGINTNNANDCAEKSEGDEDKQNSFRDGTSAAEISGIVEQVKQLRELYEKSGKCQNCSEEEGKAKARELLKTLNNENLSQN